jgi:hypothetical protein
VVELKINIEQYVINFFFIVAFLIETEKLSQLALDHVAIKTQPKDQA